MGVESVSVAAALSHADTLEIPCHSITRVLLPALESMESRRHTSCRRYIQRMFTYKINEVQHLNYWERLHELSPPETPRTLYNYIYLEDNTAYCEKY